LLLSTEADVYPLAHPERIDLIDSTIGEGSPFERAFTAVLPAGGQDRLVLVSNENTRAVRGWCLEVHDPAIAKYVAGREKELDFNAALIRHGMVQSETLASRLKETQLIPELRSLTEQRIARQSEEPG
jgi:hypothetical protein